MADLWSENTGMSLIFDDLKGVGPCVTVMFPNGSKRHDFVGPALFGLTEKDEAEVIELVKGAVRKLIEKGPS